MIKRKYGDRLNWKRILKREYTQQFLNTNDFKGYITLIHTIQVTEPLSVIYGETEICIVDNGYMWLQHFPLEKNHSVTTMFDANGQIVQWYIDISLQNGEENGTPWMDDLFLDLVLLPTGEMIEKDADELEEALSKGEIELPTYHMAWNELMNIKRLVYKKEFGLINLSHTHKNILLKDLK
ncbi:DUF402 domain-containing protein [Bacillus salitolerans]|uniref:DUF402 domain-containing protein n=1 Tax=Bacillus salitolerans TaxID=1437434 RepID=A0ABW4LXS8_9BACI